MIFQLLGKVLSTPVRILNIPLKVLDDIADPVERPLRDRDPLRLDQVADAIDDAFHTSNPRR